MFARQKKNVPLQYNNRSELGFLHNTKEGHKLEVVMSYIPLRSKYIIFRLYVYKDDKP